MEESYIPGPPGTRYLATWGRKTAKSKTFIGRVYEEEEGGACVLAVCDHRHPTKEAGHDCARSVAQELAEEAIEAYAKMAADMGSMEEQLRQAIGASLPGIDSITFANPDGSDETVIDLRSDGR